MNIPAFTLYGLIGCHHCEEADNFLRSRNLPYNVVISNNDPIAEAGIKIVLKLEESTYPVLICKLSNEVISGFKREEYERVASDYYTRTSASTSSIFSGRQ